MKNDWLQLLLELKQAVCSSYHHCKWKEVDWKHFLLETGKRQDGRFVFQSEIWGRPWFYSSSRKRLVKRANVASEWLTSHLAGVRTAGAITNKMPSQNNQTVGDFFFFLHWFCLRCVWRFFTFLVYWSNKQKNLWNCEAFPWLGTSTADRQEARAAKRALYNEENTHTHIHTQKVPT